MQLPHIPKEPGRCPLDAKFGFGGNLSLRLDRTTRFRIDYLFVFYSGETGGDKIHFNHPGCFAPIPHHRMILSIKYFRNR